MSNTTLINASKIIVQMALKTIVPTALQIVVQIIVQIALQIVLQIIVQIALVDLADYGGPSWILADLRGPEN